MLSVDEEADWLRRHRTRLGWSAQRLAQKTIAVAQQLGDDLDLSQQAVSHFEGGRNKRLPRWLRFAKAAIEIEGLTGEDRHAALAELIPPALKGTAPPASDHESQWLTILRRANDGQRDAILKFLSAKPAEQILDDPTVHDVDAVMIRQVEVGYSMGPGSVIEDWPTVQMVPISRSWLRDFTNSPPEMIMVARGEGDSMQPTILDGDLVIIDRAQTALRQADRVWALAYAGYGMIKRLRPLPDGTLQINSDNPAVTPIAASDGEAYIVGRVVGVVRRI